MPAVFPFRAVQFRSDSGDVSDLIAPPYDVLDAPAKARLTAKNRKNVVAIDLPHTPAKELGPPGAYEGAASLYRSWLAEGALEQGGPAMFAYRQTTRTGSTVSRRCGMACTVEVVPFGPREGGGILPHEETFSGPKQDRFALMKATRAQLSPIFGLHADESGNATKLLHGYMEQHKAEVRAEMGDGVLHEVWRLTDGQVLRAYQGAMAGEDIFIADGHHRYGTALNYLHELEGRGPVAPDHPARRCMMVLVGMSDPGLIIWPTHRVLGGMKDYTVEAFMAAAQGSFSFEPVAGGLSAVEATLNSGPRGGANRFGVFDYKTGRAYIATTRQADPLIEHFPQKPAAWRGLDVAVIQYLIVECICQPKLNAGEGVKWAFPHTIDEVVQIGRGGETGAGGGKGFSAQVAIIVRPTPLEAVREVSRANQLMPQKSTFFYPKLATGLFINPLE